MYSVANSLLRSQLEDLRIILKILDRIQTQQSSYDADILVPSLIGIADTAQTLSNWLNQPSLMRQKWTYILRKVEIEEAFCLLHRKCQLLVFYYCERNNSALNHIEANMSSQTSVALPLSEHTTASEGAVIPYEEDANSLKSSQKEQAPQNKEKVQPRAHSRRVQEHAASIQHESSSPITEQVLLKAFETSHDSHHSDTTFGASSNCEEECKPTTKVTISTNTFLESETAFFNNHTNSNCIVEGSFDNNIAYGSSVKVGNGGSTLSGDVEAGKKVWPLQE
ncbi:MAG: hypothetical protein Q9157_004296 [Trypethelium eluteriae]